MKTILSQLPIVIEDCSYSLKEKKILNEFINILQGYQVDLITDRESFSSILKESSRRFLHSNDYIDLPFLWFAVEFFENANRLLGIANFFADEYYAYLVEILRKFFQLIQNCTALNDPVWEQLQYISNKLRIPLDLDQYQVLKSVISYLKSGKFQIFTKKLGKSLDLEGNNPYNSYRRLSQFFTMVDTQLSYLFNLSAFKLTHYIFHLKLNTAKIKDIYSVIDFNNQVNTVLCLSRVYKDRETDDSFRGSIIIPTDDEELLHSHFQKCMLQGKINFYKLEKTTHINHSISFNHYQHGKGWGEISQTGCNYLTQRLTTQAPRRRRKKSENFYITPYSTIDWTVCQSSNLIEYIDLFCKFYFTLAFDNLPRDSRDENALILVTKDEERLINVLIGNKVVNPIIMLNRIVWDYSLDEFWIEAPLMSQDRLNYLLEWFPYSRIYQTEKSIIIWVVMSPKIVKCINNKLKWKIIPIMMVHSPLNPEKSWFNTENCTWKSPEFC